jgi:hypothetical protein
MQRTTLLLPFLLLLVLVRLPAQCVTGDCQNGKGAYLLPGGAKYVGEFQNGDLTGKGSCYYDDGSWYQGDWLKGNPHGRGLKVYPSGKREEGIWRKGYLVKEEEITAQEFIIKGKEASRDGCVTGDCINGQGIYIYPSGAVYIGDFRNGEIHGVGVCYYSDGSKYQGEWAFRYPTGKGTKTYSDGSKRTGLWKNGQPVDANGNIETALATTEVADLQTGCLSGNCQRGNGVFAYPDGSKYEGQFAEGKPNGYGAFFYPNYPNGDKYIGTFLDGAKHGTGTLFKPDGTTQTGQWREGEYLGEKAVTQVGCIKGDCQNGSGTYIFKNGARYNGQFLNKLPHGEGKAEYANGERYEGEWAGGSFNGFGTLHLVDGGKASGYWREGTYIGAKNPYILQDEPVEPNPQREVKKPIAPMNPTSKIWAVIIGVAAYNHMPVLRYTDDDAYRIHGFLKSPEGGAIPDEQMEILIDDAATYDNIKSTMQRIFNQAGPSDMVVLYFSGHGLKGSFLPFDFDGFDHKLPHEEITAFFKNSPAKFKLCIADACHSGSLLAMRSGSAQSIITTYYDKLAEANGGTALLLSSKSEETSLESSGLRQGVFSHFLIKGLKGEADANSDSIISVQELYEYVFENVRTYTGNRQTPVILGDYDKKMPVAMKR